MPIYEYKCLKCGHQFENLQKVNSDDLIICPKCKAPKLQRLISNTSFQLKGSGWYVTDYKKSGSTTNSVKKDKKGSAAATTKTTDNKTDKK